MNPRAATLALLFTAQAIAPLAHAEGQDAIDYRKHVMQTLQAQTSALGMIMSGTIPDDNAVAHMEIIAATAKTALKSFEPKVEGGDAKPEVWSNWADFSARMQDFVDKSAEMARVGREQSLDEAYTLAIDALNCKSCHDVYNSKPPGE